MQETTRQIFLISLKLFQMSVYYTRKSRVTVFRIPGTIALGSNNVEDIETD